MNEIKKNKIIIFGLSTSKNIAENISLNLKVELGKVKFKKFADGEMFIESETSVRGKKVFVIQSTQKPANDNLMELLLFLDALKRSSAKEINVIIPYFGYARQDRRVFGRQSISAKLVANLITIAGANRVITFDIHSEQIVGFFDLPMDNLKTQGIFAKEIKSLKIKDITVVSPDHGGVKRAREFARILDNSPLAVIDKRRQNHNEAEAMFILGNVKDRNVVIFDDMIDTGGTVISAIKKIKENGAKDIYLAIVHPVLSGTLEDPDLVIKKLKNSGLKKMFTTNSINIQNIEKYKDFINQIDLSNAISEVINKNIDSKSISDYFVNEYDTKL